MANPQKIDAKLQDSGDIKSTHKFGPNEKVLLTSIYGPYGIKENEYEAAFGMLADAQKVQLTYGQGVHSPQTTQPNYGLHLMAANITIPTTVMDYPSWRQFTRELKLGYTYVGISFIMANTLKAKRMAEYIRKYHPEIRILLGGYGTLILGVDQLIPNDGVCHSEGIRWLRQYFNEDTDAPIIHPIMPQFTELRAYGINVTNRLKSYLLIAGLGCKGGCDFCSSTLLFGLCNYVPLMHNGQTLFSFCEKAEQEADAQRFSVLDDNFLKNSPMPIELLAAMEKNEKAYCFTIFASADVVKKMGVDFLVRLGIEQVWIGVESETFTFSKLSGIDILALIEELHEKGVTVITSSMLFMEHHNRENLETDIDWAINLHSEIHQFSIFTPMPGTCAFARFSEKGYLPPNIDLRELHGSTLVASRHPHFKPDEARKIQFDAYNRKYNADGSSTLLKCRTMVKGYLRAVEDIKTREKMGLVWNPDTLRYEQQTGDSTDNYMRIRLAEMRERAKRAWPILLTCRIFTPNIHAKNKAIETAMLYEKAFGKPSLFIRVASVGVLTFAVIEAIKIKLNAFLTGNSFIARQPPIHRTRYHH